MPEHQQSILRRATAVVEGGREGHGRSLDGRLVADLSVPDSMGDIAEPGTNPKELFAVGYSSCSRSALLSVAAAGRGEPA
jgi:lipoyl-dependent peroxiredoxin